MIAVNINESFHPNTKSYGQNVMIVDNCDNFGSEFGRGGWTRATLSPFALLYIEKKARTCSAQQRRLTKPCADTLSWENAH